MKRKIPALLLALAMIAGLFGASPAAAASDSDTELAMAVFEGLGAFEDGAMTSSAAITRGEFARLLAYALGKGGEASSYARRTMYTDVPAGSDNASYINLVSSEGVLTGNGDGTFDPDEGITYASAVTAAIKMLGYTSAEVGTAWPEDYISLADGIGLSSGLSLSSDSTMTAGQAAQLLFNAMRGDTASGASYASQMSSSSVSDAILLSNSASSDLGYNSAKVYANGSSTYYSQAVSLPGELVGTGGTLLLNFSGSVCGFIPDAASVVQVKVKSATSASLTTDGGASYSIPSSASLVYRAERYSYATGYIYLSSGTTVRLFIGSDGEVETVSMPTATSGTAVVASSGGSSALSSFIKGLGVTGSYTLYKNGAEAAADDLAKYDVATYDSANAAVLVSDRRITGAIEAVYPSMDAPQTVTVAGVEYSVLESAQDDFSKLTLGRTVTLLLTTDAAVAAAETASSYKSDMIGILEENSDGTYTVSLPGGLSVSGEVSSGVEERYIGTLVSVKSSGSGRISVTPISDSDAYGRLSISEGTLGSYDLAAGAAIYEWAGRGYVREISLDDIDWTDTVGAASISYAYVNSAGEVDIVLLNSVTGNSYTYGIASMTSGEGTFGSSTSLTVTNSEGSTGALSGASGIRTGAFVGVAYTAAGAVADTVTLSGRSVERSDFVGSEYVDVDGTLYRISDDVQVYNTTTGTWYTDSASLGTALEQALAYSEDITVYYDRDADNGGRIRVVTVA